jgi:RND family efflux transporter MFP subunit
MKKTRFISILISAILVLFTVGCNNKPELKNKNAPKSPKNATLRQQLEELRGGMDRIEVPVIRLTTGTITSVFSIAGELVPRQSAIVNPLMDGRITFQRKIKVGDLVKKEEIIARIDDRDIEDEIEQQKRQIAISKETLKLDENELEQKQKDLVFDHGMLKEGFLNQNEFRKSELALKRAEISLRKSNLNLEQEENKLLKVMRKREKVPVKAPISGMIVLASHLKNQASASGLLNEEIMSMDDTLVGPGTQIFGIISQNEFLAQCLINGKDKAKIHIGQEAELTVITHKAIKVPGELIKIDLLQDAQSKAYKIWIRLKKSRASFTSGLFVRAKIELEKSENTIVVKKDFVKERDNKYFVQIVENNKVVDKWITPGIKQGNEIEIIEGVSLDDFLIVSKNVLSAGQDVKPLETTKENRKKAKNH